MQIANRDVSRNAEPFIIAEMSGNHNGSLDKGLALVEAAAKAGAHALKLQTFRPETITLDIESDLFRIQNPDSLWHGRSLVNLYREAWTPWEWHKPLMDKAKDLGMLCFSTPFDELAVDFLEELGVPAYKIASFESNHLPLLRKVAATGKPVFLSTGMATLVELAESVQTLRDSGCEQLCLLKCTSSYPATPDFSNVATIPHMRDLFQCEVGLSDHTLGTGVAAASVALGAVAIEKHFTLKRSEGGLDAAFSLEPSELLSLVQETERAWKSIGCIQYGPTSSEVSSLIFRRSLFICKDLNPGDTLNTDSLRIIRPGFGLAPRHIDHLIGRKVTRSIAKGTPFQWDMV